MSSLMFAALSAMAGFGIIGLAYWWAVRPIPPQSQPPRTEPAGTSSDSTGTDTAVMLMAMTTSMSSVDTMPSTDVSVSCDVSGGGCD